MFSGIIENLGIVQSVRFENNAMIILIDTFMRDLSVGESVAVNGVCLTVTECNREGRAIFFLSSETLERSSLKKLVADKYVNLERAVTPSTRLSGHIVQGHVDGTARFVNKEQQGEAHTVLFSMPKALRKYVVEKGSIAIDGVSLTLNKIKETNMDEAFDIQLMIIPHTWEHTTFGQMTLGENVNIEVDIIAKYVENICLFQK
ncbi:Riboflavin synthase [Commensalibacter sp. Nvir]|uniref:riboflavin synthase n=1 Tax=Commensalibacter sp. Nvir TaxID=3069817 RepID=UPI002D2AB7AD|nr:Riboflavin synthase [Commensalibacter sp. Nvir]